MDYQATLVPGMDPPRAEDLEETEAGTGDKPELPPKLRHRNGDAIAVNGQHSDEEQVKETPPGELPVVPPRRKERKQSSTPVSGVPFLISFGIGS